MSAQVDDVYILGLIGGFFLLFIILAIICYVINALVFFNTAKANGPEELAFLAWIPIINYYLLFAFGSKKTTPEEVKKDALIWAIIYVVLLILSAVPLIGVLTSIAVLVISVYYFYRLFYRWTGETTKAVLFVILTFITGSIFYYIYGLIKMKQKFVAA